MANEDVAKYLLKARKNNPVAVYIAKNSVRENDILRRLREKTIQELKENTMISAPEQVQLISMLLKLMNAKKAIEIGVFTGYNILNIAMALPKDGKVIGCDISADYVNMGKPFFAEAGVSDKIDLRIQSAVKTLDELLTAGEGGTFDFIYIDADKPSMDTYYEKALQLVRTGGLIGLDNVLWDGKVLNPELHHDDERTNVIVKLNEKIHKDSRVEMSLVPFADGLTLCRKL